MLALTGCATTGEMKSATSGATGCEPNRVKILKDYGRGAWKAKCDGKIYVCSAIGGSVNCKQKKK